MLNQIEFNGRSLDVYVKVSKFDSIHLQARLLRLYLYFNSQLRFLSVIR